MSECVYCNEELTCVNKCTPQSIYGWRCIEADNLLKDVQTVCKYHTETNELCLYLFEGKCANELSAHHGKSCIRHSGDVCAYFMPSDIFMKSEKPAEQTAPDNVNHPSHYTHGGIECIKAIEASMSPEGFQDYCKGNVLKYTWRWREKNGLEDLKKAQVYLGWMIESVEKQKETT